MRVFILLGALFACANSAMAQVSLFGDLEGRRERVSRGGAETFTFSPASPHSESQLIPFHEKARDYYLQSFKTEEDLPTQDSYGRGVTVADGANLSRENRFWGLQLRLLLGGGCVPAGGPLTDPSETGCLQDGNGNYVYKERERWTIRTTYIDKSVTPNVERRVGNGGGLLYVNETPERHLKCFVTAFPCDYYGIELDRLEAWTVADEITCDLKTGTEFRTTVFYQYSRYKSGSVPAGAVEWEPATIPATATKLEVPGKESFTTRWTLTPPKDNFLVRVTPSMIHTGVENGAGNPTGGSAIKTVKPGRGSILVRAHDGCEPVGNAAFSVDVEYVPRSGGHDHFESNDIIPPLSKFGTFQSSYAGSTAAQSSGSWGSWETSFTAGVFGGEFKVTAKTQDTRVTAGMPAGSDGTPAVKIATTTLRFGYPYLKPFTSSSIEPDVWNYIRLAGGENGTNCGNVYVSAGCRTPGCQTKQICDNHKNKGHYGSDKLFDLIEAFVVRYLQIAAQKNLPIGTVGINDMSLVYGGRFDMYGKWADVLGTYVDPKTGKTRAFGTSHGTHRIGVEFDCERFVGVGSNRVAVSKAVWDAVAASLGAQKMIEEQLHYRLPPTVIDEMLEPYKDQPVN